METHEIILVNEMDEEIGTAPKMDAHEKGLLHRAFSVFIFNTAGKLLLQQRADEKYHCGGLWTNTCCSHPMPGEITEQAAARRLYEEMGFQTALQEIFHFTYNSRFENGLTEYEYDHVFAGEYEGPVQPDKKEVKDFRFLHLYKIKKMMEEDPAQFTPWFIIAFPEVENWWMTKYQHLLA
ncbi:MAG: isopentenyl-diphosphate Delta-isomerase [Terrimonas sp.]|nr:isopentenyl-diphosphate Delta-isomerase [Terrimonas sp.]